MRLVVEYSRGAWEFSVEGSDGYTDTFEVTSLADAQAAAGDLMKEIAQDEEDEDLNEVLFGEES